MELQPEEEVACEGAWHCQLLHVLAALGFSARIGVLRPMELVAGFTLSYLGLEQCFGVLFNLFLGQEKLIPVHFPLPKASAIFSNFYVLIASGKVWFVFTRAHRAAGLCRAGEVGVRVPAAFEGSSILCQSKSSPPTHPWGCWAPWRCRDKSQWVTQSESASAHRCWGLWCRRSSARRKAQNPAIPGGFCGQPGCLGAQLLPAVPRDPRAAAAPQEHSLHPASPTPTPQRFISCNKTSPVERGHPAAGLFPAGSGCRRV